MQQEEGYNGWKNWETWNVSLWLGNDEGLYNLMCELAKKGSPYRSLAEFIQEVCELEETPDGVNWLNPCLDFEALDAMMKESVDE